MKKHAYILLLLLSANVFGAAYITKQSGLFTAGSTWHGGVAPSVAGDTWWNSNNIVLTYDSATGVFWGGITNSGTVYMSNGVPFNFNLNGNMTNAFKC